MEKQKILPSDDQEEIAKFLADWVKTAETVDFYQKPDREVYVATNGNEHLMLTCHRVDYPGGRWKFPHVVLVWVKDGQSEVVIQDILKAGRTTHSTGLIWGERLETVWQELYQRREPHTVKEDANGSQAV